MQNTNENQLRTEEKQLTELRQQMVAKNNTLIQKALFKLTATEFQLFQYIISKIKPTDTLESTRVINVDLVEFANCIGTKLSGGNVYKRIEKALLNLREASVVIETHDRKTLTGLILEADLQTRSTKAQVHMSDKMLTYLLYLTSTGNYTQYRFQWVCAMKSIYAMRIYELCKSYQALGTFSIEHRRICELLGCNYKPRDFKRRVIAVALREINDLSDLDLTCSDVLHGREIKSYLFTIKTKKQADLSLCIKRVNLALEYKK